MIREPSRPVKNAAERGAALTRQLLAFSRKQVLQPEILDLNETATGLEKMLRRILGEDIEFRQSLASDLGVVHADPGQVEQVMMNLVVNARDAMPEGGTLTIATSNVEIDDENTSGHTDLTPGAYVEFAITDTGTGMDEETKARIFEPFFTTKEKGKGTGLGLSTVYGIVKQSGGAIQVFSEPGRGTTFKVQFPRELTGARPSIASSATVMARLTGRETILVAEDEHALRKVAKKCLESCGYTVLAAASGDEALDMAAECSGEINLLLTDVVMPRMGGRVLAEELLKLRPTLEVLYMSGYTDDTILHHGVLTDGTHFIAKPFSGNELARKVHEVLDDAARRAMDTHE